MSFLGATELRVLLPTCIDKESYNPTRIKQAAYELSLGDEAFRTDGEKRKPEILDDKNKTIEINAGQFALLLSKEKVTIPNDKLAFISIKAGEKLKGLVNVSGFHVDPGFSGQLLFSVYNAGPSTITLKRGEPYFLIWFTELKSALEEADLYNQLKNDHQNQSGISTKYIDALKRGELASPNVLLDKIKERDSLLRNMLWAAGILITLGSGLTIMSLSNLARFNDSYMAGKKEQMIKTEIDSIAKNYQFDTLFEKRIKEIINLNKKDSSQ